MPHPNPMNRKNSAASANQSKNNPKVVGPRETASRDNGSREGNGPRQTETLGRVQSPSFRGSRVSTPQVSIVPREVFLIRGVGRHKEKLTSFELALRDAEIAQFNLVRVSSIFPPECKVIKSSAGLSKLKAGQVVHCVMSEASSNEPHRLMVASVGLSIPADRSTYGYLSEHHAYGQTDAKAAEYAEDLAAEMLATILNVSDFDPDKSYNELREEWKISEKIYKTKSVTQSAVGDKKGWWTTVVAGAIFDC